jgi:hypothetical protein
MNSAGPKPNSMLQVNSNILLQIWGHVARQQLPEVISKLAYHANLS